jgi:hypothetical protein
MSIIDSLPGPPKTRPRDRSNRLLDPSWYASYRSSAWHVGPLEGFHSTSRTSFPNSSRQPYIVLMGIELQRGHL